MSARSSYAERQHMLDQNGRKEEAAPGPADNTTADLKLAVYIVGSMVLMGSLPFNPGSGLLAEDERGVPLIEAIDDVRTAIREAIPVLDRAEFVALFNSDKVKRP